MVDGAAVDTEATAAVLDADPDTANFSLDRGRRKLNFSRDYSWLAPRPFDRDHIYLQSQ